MESLGHKLRNRLTPYANTIALIELYENTINGEDKVKIINKIVDSKRILKKYLDEIIELIKDK